VLVDAENIKWTSSIRWSTRLLQNAKEAIHVSSIYVPRGLNLELWTQHLPISSPIMDNPCVVTDRIELVLV